VRRLRWSLRLRLTVLYGVLSIVSGAALLAITYLLFAHTGAMTVVSFQQSSGGGPLPTPVVPSMVRARAETQHDEALRELLTMSGIALAVMSVISVVLGWLMAGRALRPVRTMVARTRRISERNLHERLAVRGPDDEVKELGDTLDGLLTRLQIAFDSQRRFVASASHELRTPLTLQRAMIEVALADPDADAASLREVCGRVLRAGEAQERLIEALLTLATSERGLDRREPVDLALVTADVLRLPRPDEDDPPHLESDLGPGWVTGDPRLVERLAANLVDNAARHNRPGGWVRVATGADGGWPVLRVTNSGPVVPPDRVGSLFRPFERLAGRTGDGHGHGLGLSIVAAIAAAHGARIAAAARTDGGLDVTVTFPRPGAAAPAVAELAATG
jgi:signal transduction histidine kinase